MRYYRNFIVLLASLLLVACGDITGTGNADLTGTWMGNIKYPPYDGIYESLEGMQIDLVQDKPTGQVSGPVQWTQLVVDNKNTGIVRRSTLSEFLVVGSVSGKTVTLAFGGGDIVGTILVKATVSGAEMHGTAEHTLTDGSVLKAPFDAKLYQ